MDTTSSTPLSHAQAQTRSQDTAETQNDDILHLEVNAQALPQQVSFRIGGSHLLITPPLDEDYWLMRIAVSPTQAVVCFPKFGTIGIGFQRADDWNTNLPYREPVEAIFAHIKDNKGDDSIPDARCVAAIRLLQAAIVEMQALREKAPR